MGSLFRRAVARVCDRLQLSSRVVVALAGLTLAFGVASVGFGGLTEDAAARNGQQRFDLRRLDWFVQHRTHAEVRAADVLAKAGAVGAMAVLAVVAAAILWRRRESVALVLAPIVAFVGAAVATSVTKTLVGRGRPPLPLRLVSDTEPSFPSGHTTATTAVVLTIAVIAAVVIFRRVVVRAVVLGGAGCFCAAVGISRLVLGAHWPTDVLAGWLLGAAVASVVLAAAVVLAPRLPSGPEVYRLAMGRWRRRRGRGGDDVAVLTARTRACAGTP